LLADPELRARLLARWAKEGEHEGWRGFRGFGIRGGLGVFGRHGACALERVDSQ
jgi:hypothetical protein